MAKQVSLKQLTINKDNTTILIAVGIASFIVVFSLIASKSLIDQQKYQAKVIDLKKKALKQMKTNVGEVDKLKVSYQAFADANQNVLGGSSGGGGDRDGENPRIVLDALPSKYDYPALATSLSKVFKQYKIDSITGTDDEVAQSAAASSASPQPVEIPFSVTVKSSPQAIKSLLQNYDRSIRPFQVQRLTIQGTGSDLTVNTTAKTYFQPQKKFDVKKEVVK